MSKEQKFKLTDILLILMMVLPLAVGIALKVLTKPLSAGIDVTGAMIYFTIPLPLGGLPITETQINSLLITITLLGLCLFLTHGIKEKPETKRQLLAEWIVETVENITNGSMGEYFAHFGPFIASILGLSAFSSLMCLVGLYPPTSDLNTTAGWAILVFILITFYKMKCGPVVYVKSFTQPLLLTPMNMISELAIPVSMAFRHYGNVLSGSVIGVLIAAGLQGLSGIVLGWLPGFLGDFPFLQIGLPAILSLYFDVFSGCLQAYIFAMLTMMYVSGGFPAEEYLKRKLNKQKAQVANE